MKKEKESFLYDSISDRILNRIFEALLICLKESRKKESVNFYSNELIRKVSAPFYKELKKEINTRRYNPHIREGFKISNRNEPHFPRISLLVIESFINAQSQSYQLIPSPLSILYKFLTVPDEPQSAAYALANCRMILFKELRIHPEHPNLNAKNNFNGFSIMQSADIVNAVDTLRNHFKKGDTILGGERSGVLHFVGHFLAMKGILFLKFGTKDETPKNSRAKIERFLEKKKVMIDLDQRQVKNEFEFKLCNNFTDIPDTSNIINQISGIPLPFRGADIIFMGGLKTTSQASLVMSVSGNSGTGKTSFALDFSSVLIPYRTKCFYISFEEEKADLKNRLATIIPDYLRKLSIWDRDIDNWLYIDRKRTKFGIDEMKQYVEHIGELTKSKVPTSKSGNLHIPAICPLVIVIDSINGVIGEEKDDITYLQLEEFVCQCRSLNAIVMLLSAERLPQNSRLNYLVDLEINLNLLHTDTLDRKPNRIFQLLKTRHQGSGFGAHLFHLSGKSGFRLSPQIPSQLDKREKVVPFIFDDTKYIHTFNVLDSKLNDIIYLKGKERFLDIYPNSKIIIHGSGSSGKAGLALKILMTPAIDSEEISPQILKKIDFNEFKYSRRILIVSFLLSEQYYRPIVKSIQDLFKGVYPNLNCNVETLSFYPGFLTPDDLISKITRSLDGAILEGKPYTGVLLDGLHNVFLQFPELQKRSSIWPMIYNLLSKFKITAVTTFTNFSIELDREDNNGLQNPEKFEIFREGQTPFLHALVQASDFFIQIEPHYVNKVRTYEVKVKGAAKQRLNNNALYYLRENKALAPYDPSKIT